jgi:hypothetical protein
MEAHLGVGTKNCTLRKSYQQRKNGKRAENKIKLDFESISVIEFMDTKD